MKDEEMVVNQNTPVSDPYSLFPRPYRIFLKPTRELGKSATSAFVSIGSLLQKTVSITDTPIDRLFIERQAKKREQDKAELSKVVSKANELLASATAVFPFDLFPDSVTVDRTKITITKRSFFWTAEVISIRIEDILNVTTGVGPFFGSLTVSSRVMSSVDHFTINYFWRKDAIQLKHIIQGYIIALHNNIDVTSLSKEELIETLAELGHDATA